MPDCCGTTCGRHIDLDRAPRLYDRGPEIDVWGVMKDGRDEPLMVGDDWHSPLQPEAVGRLSADARWRSCS